MVQMQPLFLYVRGEGFAANAGQEEAAVLGHNNAKVSFSERRRKTLRKGRMCSSLRRLDSLFSRDCRGAGLLPLLGKSFYWLPLMGAELMAFLSISRSLSKRKLPLTFG